MSYWNPVLHYGVDAFARDLAAAGGLGMITPDLIPDEGCLGCRRRGTDLDRIFWWRPRPPPNGWPARSRHPAVSSTPLHDGRDRRQDVVSEAAPDLVRRAWRFPISRSVSAWACVRVSRRPRSRTSPTGVIVGSALVSVTCRRRGCRGPHVDRGTCRRGSREGACYVTTTVLAYSRAGQGVWFLGPFPIRAYALCIIAGSSPLWSSATGAGGAWRRARV